MQIKLNPLVPLAAAYYAHRFAKKRKWPYPKAFAILAYYLTYNVRIFPE